ncbi:hypothetical protein HYU89_03995 [Candidatus Collierbacteria bacterium]|nr:hypothetical protein [Candidatus Collierbacteria bacterium]
MIHVFHGDNSELSRKSFIELIEKLKAYGLNEIVRLNGADMVQLDLIQSLESQSLFGGDRIVAIEGLLSRRPSKEKDSLLSYLSLSPCPLSLALWEPKKISAAGLKKFTGKSGVNIKEFRLSSLLYKFLDQVVPGNGQSASKTFNSLIIDEPAELVFFWLAKRATELILENSTLGSDSGYNQDWRRQKLASQAGRWTEKGLINFHRRLVEIDEAVKTGSTPSNLSSHLDIALLSL